MARGRKRGGATAERGNGGGEYEKLREQRIKENREKMQTLGIFDLSVKLKPPPPPRSKTRRNLSSSDDKNASLPPRRSYRLKTLTPVSYAEKREKMSPGNDGEILIHLEKGLKPEIYTQEEEKLLGDCKMSWTLLVDGYDKDGKRIYDPVNGKTCHQCRQKTLGHHTRCSKCELVQGQLCGDCLYMRYGENVIEVSQNPNWICPVCRGICNCSLCRVDKGWRPTGAIYRKVKKLGFKSVAHYLIQTYRVQVDTESLVSEEPSVHSLLNETMDIDEDPDGYWRPSDETSEDAKSEETKEKLIA